MSRKPSDAELGAVIGSRLASRNGADIGPLLAEKADQLERIAKANPNDRDAAALAREARAAANRAKRNSR
ncbi:hypothetical protein ABTX81_04630 [Kitasatospora sp. NPDC097605]|uniref:hypothetical protein n=1 Tax=Kitasatospora sp. NPDC097605 TaxID=3157226 RepID=UPI0033181F4C